MWYPSSTLTKRAANAKNDRAREKGECVENHLRRVVITGMGPVTPVGIGKEAYWDSLVHGKTAFKRIAFPDRDMSQYRCQIAAPIESFDLFQYVERTKHSKYLGKTSRYAIAAAALAIKDAGLELEKIERQKGDSSGEGGQYLLKGIDPFQAGVILGVGAEAMEKMEGYHEKFMQGTRGLSPFGLPNSYLSSFTSHVASVSP